MEHHTVILAAGDFPRKGGAAWKLLAAAKRVVACDSAADAYHRRVGRWPDVIVGDFDSIGGGPRRSGTDRRPTEGGAVRPGPHVSQPSVCVRIPDQDTNDLEKAMSYCTKRGWKNPVIVGATGKREDHAIGNVFRALDYGCEIVTDRGRFVPVTDKAMFNVRKGAAVSIFAPDPKTRMTSKGLEWPLDNVKFGNLYCATLNRTTGTRMTLTATKPVSVFIEEGKVK